MVVTTKHTQNNTAEHYLCLQCGMHTKVFIGNEPICGRCLKLLGDKELINKEIIKEDI